MTIDIQDRITVRMFVGCLVSSDIKHQLSQSLSWKESQIVSSKSCRKLEETHYQGKYFLGYFIDDSGSTLSEIEELKKEIEAKITKFCEGYTLNKLKFFVFPQVFVS
ncbi:MAG: hypothetical protein VX777_08395 [Chlamydiota bacterium]|nr:hypothetical protein [Chlamydiota bacterium]